MELFLKIVVNLSYFVLSPYLLLLPVIVIILSRKSINLIIMFLVSNGLRLLKLYLAKIDCLIHIIVLVHEFAAIGKIFPVSSQIWEVTLRLLHNFLTGIFVLHKNFIVVLIRLLGNNRHDLWFDRKRTLIKGDISCVCQTHERLLSQSGFTLSQ